MTKALTKEQIAGSAVPVPKVLLAIHGVSAALARDGIAKGRKNIQQSYNFRGIDEVMNALAPLLVAHGLIIMPRILERAETVRVTKGGGSIYSVTVAAEFVFVSIADGSTMVARTYGEAMDTADKATNKAMAVAYKYAAFQTFCIPTEGGGDLDPDATTPEPTVPARPATEKTEKPAERSSQPPKQDDKAASVPAAARPNGVNVQPAGEPTAKQLWDGIKHTDKQVGREGLSAIVSRFKQAGDNIGKGFNPESFPAEFKPAALNAAYAEWEAWYHVTPLSEAERAKMHKAMDAYSKAAKAMDAALAKYKRATDARAAGADPDTGELPEYEQAGAAS